MHIPVLKNEVKKQFNYLSKIKNGCFVDGTLGTGGHSLAIATKLEDKRKKIKVIGIDKDQQALELAKNNIKKAGLSDNFILIHNDFKNIKPILAELNIKNIDGALLDLGVSSMQLNQSNRGFTFQDPDAPLDMRMDQSQKLSANEVVNNFPQEDLENILRNIGEEKYYKSIARNIARFRKNKKIKTVGELLTIIKLAMPPKYIHTHSKHFATNTFRALRIVVNDELNPLGKTIHDYIDVLKSGGRLAVITFHSSEDRIVKNTFRSLENPCLCPPKSPICACGKTSMAKIVTKKAVDPNEEEIQENPRSRSAKLRVVEKL